MTQQRRRSKQSRSLEERMAEHAKQLIEAAELLPPGPVRDAALRKARDAQTGSQLNQWLRSPNTRMSG